MSKSHLPYPGRHESHESWMRRCDEWQENRRRSQSRGLSGSPEYHGLAFEGRGVEWQRVRIASQWHTVEVPHFAEHEGKRVRVLRYGWGSKTAYRVRDWAKKRGLQFARLINANGHHGMCGRDDGMAYREVAFA
jgi:hypothetical protein